MSLLKEILLYRGALVNMPLLPEGMPAFATDTGELWIGTATVNVKIGVPRVSDGNVGDLTISGGGTVYTVNNGVITLAKLANIGSQKLLGRKAAGAGVAAEITIVDALNMLGVTSGAMLWANGTTWEGFAGPIAGQTLGSKLVSGQSKPTWVWKGPVLLKDLQTSGTGGGTFTTGAWRTRTLNTVEHNADGFVTLSANQFSLLAGDYRISARAPAANVGTHQCRLQNVSAAATLAVGSSSYANPGNVQSDSCVDVCITSNGTDVYELQHQCQLTVATVGFGSPCTFGTELYASMLVDRLS